MIYADGEISQIEADILERLEERLENLSFSYWRENKKEENEKKELQILALAISNNLDIVDNIEMLYTKRS